MNHETSYFTNPAGASTRPRRGRLTKSVRCRGALSRLVDQPWRLMSIRNWQWALWVLIGEFWHYSPPGATAPKIDPADAAEDPGASVPNVAVGGVHGAVVEMASTAADRAASDDSGDAGPTRRLMMMMMQRRRTFIFSPPSRPPRRGRFGRLSIGRLFIGLRSVVGLVGRASARILATMSTIPVLSIPAARSLSGFTGTGVRKPAYQRRRTLSVPTLPVRPPAPLPVTPTTQLAPLLTFKTLAAAIVRRCRG